MGALNLKGFTVVRTSDTGRLYSFRLEKKDQRKTRLHIAASSAENADRWIEALGEATKCPVSTRLIHVLTKDITKCISMFVNSLF